MTAASLAITNASGPPCFVYSPSFSHFLFSTSSPSPSTPFSQPQSLRITLSRYSNDYLLISSHHTSAWISASGTQIPRSLDLLRWWNPGYMPVKPHAELVPPSTPSPRLNRVLCAQISFFSSPQTLPLFPLASSTPTHLLTMAPEPTATEADRLNALQMVRTSQHLIFPVLLA